MFKKDTDIIPKSRKGFKPKIVDSWRKIFAKNYEQVIERDIQVLIQQVKDKLKVFEILTGLDLSVFNTKS